jgi:hypothetical protein
MVYCELQKTKKHRKEYQFEQRKWRTRNKGERKETMDAKAMLTALEPGDFNFCKDVWSVIVQFIPTMQLAKFRAVNKLFQRLVTTEMHTRCVTLDDEIMIAQIIDFAYRECVVSHVTYQGRDYYPCDAFWCERPHDVPEREYDPNLKCDADHDDFDVALECFVEELDELDMEKWLLHQKAGTSYEELAWLFEGLPKRCPFESGEHPILEVPSPIDDGDGHHHEQLIVYHFDVADPDALGSVRERLGKAVVVFQGCSLVYLPHAIRLVNTEGVNEDHRGCNHMNIELDWYEEYVIPAGIHSVYDIVQSCFRIKGNKFENHYEMFCRIIDVEEFNSENSEDMEELLRVIDFEDSEWTVTPVIDHGS